jgi:multidrug efflux pump subunit AcrB
VALKPEARVQAEAFRERLRARFAKAMPAVAVSFEAGDIVSQVMSFGSPTPIEVAVQGPNLAANQAHAEKVRHELSKLSFLRDLQSGQSPDYPTMEINVDRERAGQYGLTATNVVKSVVAATSSSRFVDPNYWRDPVSGNAFQIQVEIPQNRIASIEDLQNVPVMPDGGTRPMLGEVATLKYGRTMGQIDRYNMQRVISFTANIHGQPLGNVIGDLRAALRRAGEPPRGVTVAVRGQIPPLEETLAGLRTGLLLSVAAIFLLLAASFQSVRLAFAVVFTAPAVLGGVALMLLLTRTTLNVQSFMGGIMATGIAVANAILLVSFAERHRREGVDSIEAVASAGRDRLRAILMTATAMIAGMLPIALGLGESGEQSASLGRAVIGGLLAATFATLTVLPAFYTILQRRTSIASVSLDPNDSSSKYYEAK